MNREAFEAWIMRTARRAGTHVNKDTTGKYLDNRVDAKWSAWHAALASQAQQPNYKLNELAQMIMSDCGISTINNDALFNRILDRLINASDLQIRPDVLCGGCKGIRSSDCPDCNGSGKMTDPRAQAQQPIDSVGNWLWSQLMDYVKSRGMSPAVHDDLFKIVERARQQFDSPSQEQQPTEVKQLRDKVFDLQGENLDMYHRILHLEGVLSANNASLPPAPEGEK